MSVQDRESGEVRERSIAEGASEAWFTGVGGVRIFCRNWRPSLGGARAVVVIAHGFNSHSGYYEWTAEQLVRQGYAVYALDHRGRGRSEGERFFVERFQEYVDDLARCIDIVRLQDPRLPIFLLGHSAGGVICCTYLLDHPEGIAGFICESFAHEVPAPEIALSVLKGLSHVIPHTHVLRLRNEDFSRDPSAVAAMNADPLIHHETQPAQTVAEMVRADERLKRDFSLFALPVLILHGTDDRVTLASGSERFHAQAASADKTLKLYEGHYHDLLADLGKEQVMSDITEWIAARL